MRTKIGVDAEFVCATRRDPLTDIGLRASGVLEGDGHLGVDGAGTPFEVRSLPSSNPAKVVDSMREAMALGLMVQPSLKQYPWACGSMAHPCGFHIHLDRDLTETGSTAPIECLDLMVSMPLAKSIPSRVFLSRIENGYGQLNSFRMDHRQSNGKGNRVEYRTLGGVWDYPSTTTAILGWARDVAEWPLDHADEYLLHYGDLAGKCSEILGKKWADVNGTFQRRADLKINEWNDLLYRWSADVPSLQEWREPFFTAVSRERKLYDLKETWDLKELPVVESLSPWGSVRDYLSALEIEATHGNGGPPLPFYRKVRGVKSRLKVVSTYREIGYAEGVNVIPIHEEEEDEES